MKKALRLGAYRPADERSVGIARGQDQNQHDLASAEIYDPKIDSFATASSSLATARRGHVALALAGNGNVLVAGGTSAGTVVESTELYEGATASFVTAGGFTVARSLFGSNFLAVPSGTMVLASGGLGADSSALASSEAFSYPTVKTDKPDYFPGEQVTISGSGWSPNASLVITLHEDDNDPETILTATADGTGAFSHSDFVIQQDVGVTFIATVVGQSGRDCASQVHRRWSDGLQPHRPVTERIRRRATCIFYADGHGAER